MVKRKEKLTVETVQARAYKGQVLFGEKEVLAVLGRIPKKLTNMVVGGKRAPLYRVLEVMNYVDKRATFGQDGKGVGSAAKEPKVRLPKATTDAVRVGRMDVDADRSEDAGDKPVPSRRRRRLGRAGARKRQVNARIQKGAGRRRCRAT